MSNCSHYLVFRNHRKVARLVPYSIPARDVEYPLNACGKVLVPSVVSLGGYGTIKKGILLGSLGSLRLGP